MLQFITDSETAEGTIIQALTALKGGCRWIQIRMKEAEDAELEKVIRTLLPYCHSTAATLIVDDRVEIAARCGADGVHLGKNDMNPLDARALIGPEKIIGATVNKIEDIGNLNLEAVDYLGIGPFRFTTTKKHLAPTLGLEGYRKIMARLRAFSDIPAVAIGGITAEDIPAIMQTGVTGIAVSGAIARAENSESACRNILALLDNYRS